MAYPLNTFNDAQPAPAPRTGVGRFTQEVVLVLGLALIIFARHRNRPQRIYLDA